MSIGAPTAELINSRDVALRPEYRESKAEEQEETTPAAGLHFPDAEPMPGETQHTPEKGPASPAGRGLLMPPSCGGDSRPRDPGRASGTVER